MSTKPLTVLPACPALRFLLIVVLLSPTAAWAQPKIGYVYPSGGQQGTTFRALVAGRQVARCTEVLVSGQGVEGRVIRAIPRMTIGDSEDNFVARQMYEMARARVESEEPSSEGETDFLEAVRKHIAELRAKENGIPQWVDAEGLPDPGEIADRLLYFDRLTTPTEKAVQLVFYEYYSPRADKGQKEAIGQGLVVEMTIAADAEPGDRDLRLFGQAGLTVPVRFVVGTVPEVSEREPNDTASENPTTMELWGQRNSAAPKTMRSLPVLQLPVVFNGQVRAGDIDRFRFEAREGQKLVFDVRARRLVPYLADGVPGWFQAAVSLYDPEGRKIAEAMSYRHEADPVLLVEIPRTGIYTIAIQDSVFRGRDDFVYRISAGESPWINSVFPLGVSKGHTKNAELEGWNLPESTVLFDAGTLETGIHEITTLGGMSLPRPIRFAVDDFSETMETEPNGDIADAKTLEWPVVVNGRISEENDVDYYAFEGVKGQRIVLDVTTRQLDSPLDAVLELLDASGKVIASNDDRADCNGPNIGLQTHHADPYLDVELPADGRYVARIFDVTQQGGKAYGYRLRISRPRPDFTVLCEPPSVLLRRNKQALKFHLIRHDGFDGEVKLRPVDTKNFQIENGKIGAGKNEASPNLIALPAYDGLPTELRIEAVATIDGAERVRPVLAVENREQAFIYFHWVSAKSLVVSKPWKKPEE